MGRAQAAAAAATTKPYHHGDLRRALLDAALTIIERDGAAALTLRAVAREAGVSPAAPYHHFQDKSELMLAVSKDGFRRLNEAMALAAAERGAGEVGLAYIEFAHDNPALYRVMYDCARAAEMFPEDGEPDKHDGLELVKAAINRATNGKADPLDVELAAIAAWALVHGLAEISRFDKFTPMKELLGGERSFIKAVLEHAPAHVALRNEH
ncbi:MAG TPA: TetR/AcrR family transcriptional regulator [Caulobacteraceae bacterium]|nr:TetR/AcrR family transcriptional regulator [Caulobacteraceae bacterium]